MCIRDRYREIEARCGVGSFRAGMGAEAVKEMLMELDLDAISEKLKKEISELAEKERDRDTEGQKLSLIHIYASWRHAAAHESKKRNEFCPCVLTHGLKGAII